MRKKTAAVVLRSVLIANNAGKNLKKREKLIKYLLKPSSDGGVYFNIRLYATSYFYICKATVFTVEICKQ